MGLFSFLQKRHGETSLRPPKSSWGPAVGSGIPIKSQAYDSTEQGTLPVVGDYPMSGNGQRILVDPRRENRSALQVPTTNDDAAPSPAVPRYIDDYERPNTAPNASRTGSIVSGAPSRLRRLSPDEPLPSVPRIDPDKAWLGSRASKQTGKASASIKSGSSLLDPSAHLRNNSMRSNTDQPFKDILDAQSEINPADFRARVQATGARDYGEDVADRNIGQNGLDLESPQVQAYYAASSNGSMTGQRDGSSLRSFQRDEPGSRPLSQSWSTHDGAGLRSKSLTSTTHPIAQSGPFPPLPTSPGTRTSNRTSMIAPTPSIATSRRQSLYTYAPSSTNGRASEKSTADDDIPLPYFQKRTTTNLGRPKTSHVMHPSISSSVASQDTVMDFNPLPYPSTRPRTGYRERSRSHGRYATATSREQELPYFRSGVIGASTYTKPRLTDDKAISFGASSRRRSHSTTSVTEHEADRISSRSKPRSWSISSATHSSTSSDSFKHSRHTPNTSTDLSNTYSAKSSSRTSLSTTIANSPGLAKSPQFNLDDYLSSDDDDEFGTPRPRGQGEEELLFNDTGFLLNGAFLPGLRSGLSSPTRAAQTARPMSSASSKGFYDTYNGAARGGQPSERQGAAPRRYILDTAADSDFYSDDDESDMESWHDARENRGSQESSVSVSMRGTKRLSAIGTSYGQHHHVSDVIEEEQEHDKIDAPTVAR